MARASRTTGRPFLSSHQTARTHQPHPIALGIQLLTSIFPALERAFDYSTRSALILVAGFQTPDAIRAAGADGLTRYLTEHDAWARGVPAMVDKALAAAAAQTVRLPGEATTAVLIARLARHLLDLNREIKDTDKLIVDRRASNPEQHQP